jgi:hypothetical protein
MTGQALPVQKKRGRPTGRVRPPTTALRLENDLLRQVDEWIAVQPAPTPNRPEAIKRLVENGLDKQAAKSVQSDASLDQQIAAQKAAIAEMPELARSEVADGQIPRGKPSR